MMQIFDRNTEQDAGDIQEWLQEIKTELKQTATDKAGLYSFDFLQNAPIENEASRYKWQDEKREIPNHRLESRHRPTLSRTSRSMIHSMLQLNSFESITSDNNRPSYSTYN